MLPVSLIILLLAMTAAPVSLETLLLFLAGAVLLVVGMGLFTLGADMAMMPMGEALGRKLARSKRVSLMAAVFFLVGVLVTVAEPDLTVLATQVPGIPNPVLIWTVAAGVGLFLVVSVLRTVWKVPLRWVLLVLYAAVFLLSFFIPRNMLAVAFDAGGVTTGPITVPFIMALGLGVSATRGDPDSEADSFGVVALASVGPVLAVLILGLLYRPDGAGYEAAASLTVPDSRAVAAVFWEALPHYAREVLLALAPIAGLFLVFQLLTRAFKPKGLARIGVGLIYTLVGLVLFLTGVNVGFLPAGRQLGQALGSSAYSWSLIPLGALLGWFIVEAEPAVHVLCVQVESVTGGAVSKNAMGRALSIGMAVDANVIIFERIKEELRNGKSTKSAIKSGFHRAFAAILDSNVTTFIAAGVLYVLGSGSIKGFAFTLGLGVILSMFTALVLTKYLMNLSADMNINGLKLYGVRERKAE